MRRRAVLLPACSLFATGLLVGGLVSPATSARVEPDGSLLRVEATIDRESIFLQCRQGQVRIGEFGPQMIPMGCWELAYLDVDMGPFEGDVSLGADSGTFPDLARASIRTANGAPNLVRGIRQTNQVVADGQDEVHTGEAGDAVEGGGSVYTGGGNDAVDHRPASFRPTAIVTGDGDDQITGRYGLFRRDDRTVDLRQGGRIDAGAGFDTWRATFVDRGPSAQVLSDSSISHAEGMLTLSGIDRAELTFASPAVVNARGFTRQLEITTGDDPDSIVTGAVHTVVRAGAGNDVVEAWNGMADAIDCGEGADRVVADVADVLTGCETVELPSVPTPTPAPTPTPTPGTTTPTPGTTTPTPGTPVSTPTTGTPGTLGTPIPTPGTSAPTPGAGGQPAAVQVETGEVKGKKKVRKGAWAKFRFSSSTRGATFQCRVDRRSWNGCASPYRVSTKHLKRGKHVFSVRAVRDGVRDSSPSRRKFKVTGRRG